MLKKFNAIKKYFKLSYVNNPVNETLVQKNIGQVLRDKSVKNFKDMFISVPFQNIDYTYKDVYEKALIIAGNLRKMGLKEGEKIGIYSPNCIEWFLLQMAVSLDKFILVNINPNYKSSELKFSLNLSEVKFLFIYDNYLKNNYLNIFEQIDKKDLKTVESVFIISEEYKIDHNYKKFNDLLTKDKYFSNIVENEIDSINIHSATNIQFTSGTTGLPKGAVLTHSNLINNGYYIGKNLKYDENDRICISVPLYHCFGMVIGNLAALNSGSHLVYPSQLFNGRRSMEICEKYDCTSMYGVPTMFIEYLKFQKENNYNLKSLNKGIIAGSLCPESLLKNCIKYLNLNNLLVAYGMTETSPVSFFQNLDDSFVKKTTTVGKILPHLEGRIVNSDNNKILNCNEIGEVQVKGYSLMKEYYNDIENSKKALTEDGFIKTGDLGYIDEEGYLVISGRFKDLIIRGGENIIPKEIEDYFLSLENVENCQVIGVNDEKYGEEILALIILKDKSIKFDKSLELLKIKSQLSNYKIPRYLDIVDSLPITVTGKPQKFKMRETYNKLLENIVNTENFNFKYLK